MDNTSRFGELFSSAEGYIFDFDGFIADSEKYHYKSYSEVFARYGHTIDEKEYYKYWTSMGLGAKGEIERFELDLDPAEIKKEKNPIFSRYCEDGSITLFPEARRMIELFVETKKPLAIASGSATNDIRAVLRNGGVADYFQTVLGSDLVPKIKPHPDIFLKAAEELKLDPPSCLVLEDAEKGMLAANDASMPVVIVRTRETKDFDFKSADVIFDSHAELVSAIEALL